MSHRPLSATARLRVRRALVALLAGGSVLLTSGPAAYGGDILRGGAATSSARNNSSARSGAGSQAAALAKANAQDRLAQTTQALQSMKAMQDAARSAARGQVNLGSDPNNPGRNLINVPDGLVAGGLEVAAGVGTDPTLWQGALLPKQGGSGQVAVLIKQTKQQALLNWKTFNVGRNTTVTFDQSAGGSNKGQWIAFNKISDPSGSPSQILGSIKADGQVYLLNQNGIIFGGASQVNTHALVAASLPINDNLITRGLLNNPDSQFLFSALPIAAGTSTPAFTPVAALTPTGKRGDIVVQPGAIIESPTSATKIGGRVALVGPNVTNRGTITTPDGQTILAAGLQVGMEAHASSDPSLRGLDVSVGEVGNYAGTTTNAGLIEAHRASVLLTGRNVQQLGVIDSTTSVSLNGRVDLLANYNAIINPAYDPAIPSNGARYLFKNTGNVTLGPDSVTQILPEIASDEKVVGTELALRSQLNIQGLTINLGPSARVLAPNANVSLLAGQWGFTPSTTRPLSQFVYSNGQIYLDSGAFIDVAGSTDVWVPLTHQILSVTLRGSELADSPLLRDQPESAFRVRGTDLLIDLRRTGTYNGKDWVGTPLGDASGFAGLIERTVAQLTTAGGSVTMKAGGSVVVQKGAKVDVSGGWVKYEGGYVQTTRLMYRGNVVDVADATPDRTYDGIYTGENTERHHKWGISETYTHPLALTGRTYQRDYLEGKDSGSIAITAPVMALDGTLTGATVNGPRQVRSSDNLSSLAKAGELSLTFQKQSSTAPQYLTVSPTPPTIVFANGRLPGSAVGAFSVDAAGLPNALPPERQGNVQLSADLLTRGGFGKLTVDNSDGTILVPENVKLTAGPDAALAFSAANITVDGEIKAPSGEVTFNAYNLSPFAVAELRNTATPVTPSANADRGRFVLGPKAVIDASGVLVDDRPGNSRTQLTPLSLEGGKVTINAYEAVLAEGSRIDVSGGAAMTQKGKLSYGDAGEIAINTGRDLSLTSVVGGGLKLGAELRGFSGGKGGALTLQAPLIQVGGRATGSEVLAIAPEFFNEGGFTSFTLTGIGAGTLEQAVPALVIAANTRIAPVAKNLIAIPNAGRDGLGLREILLPMESRTPVSLAFNALGARDTFTNLVTIRGEVVMEKGVSIQTDPLASVSFSGNTVLIEGTVEAPAGKISVTGAANSSAYFTDASRALGTVYLSPAARLSAAGTVLATSDPYGRNTARVLSGGSISLSGNLVAEAGAVLDVSGTSKTVDVPAYELGLVSQPTVHNGINAPLFRVQSVPFRVDSDGGSITLKGGQMLFSDATLLGKAGGPTALGGTLIVSSSRYYESGVTPTPLDINLEVGQNGLTLSSSFAAKGQTAIGRPVLDAAGKEVPGLGYFRVDRFHEGGFDNLTLGGVINFRGPVNVNARGKLTVADGGIIYADSEVNLKAAYAVLGTPFITPQLPDAAKDPFILGSAPFNFPPTFGSGVLNVEADFIDVGNLSLQGIGRARLSAVNGDIRGNGTLNISGDLVLQAAQVYPVTAREFTIVAYDHAGLPGSVTVVGAGSRRLPLSAGGTLSIYASIIQQEGTLVAPLGIINLGWDGEGTAPTDLITNNPATFPVTQRVTLSKGSYTSVAAVDPVTGQERLIPYGLSADGTTWIDPTGTDITAIGIPTKSIRIAGANVDSQAGSMIDVRGGGDLYAYRWVEGLGGSQDILAASGSYAVIPDFDSPIAPYAPFNNNSLATNLGLDPGFVNNNLKAGDRIYLKASPGLATGYYTLLPARYALLPGAFLVTPKSGNAGANIAYADGSNLVSGYRYNSLNQERELAGRFSRFEVISGDVIRQRSSYEEFTANTFLRESAARLNLTAGRLPNDAGHLVLQATAGMILNGSVRAQGGAGGRGGLVDIASPLDILIGNSSTPHDSSVLFLDAGRLSSFGAESLLVGGVRTYSSTGVTVSVKTNSLTVDNAGSPLTGPDIVLVANETLRVAAGAQIFQTGSLAGSSDRLRFGDASVAGSGNGALLRVSSDPRASIVRSGVNSNIGPEMIIEAGALLGGTSLILDSTRATYLDPAANLDAKYISLNSGRISILFDNPGSVLANDGLVLSGEPLRDLQKTTSLSLLSYTSIDLYGTGSFAGTGDLALHAAQIRGFSNAGGTVSFSARNLTLDNGANATPLAVVGAPSGTLAFRAQNLTLGANTLAISQYANFNLSVVNGTRFTGTGRLTSQGAVTLETPYLTAGKGADHGIVAAGELLIQAPAGSRATGLNAGLGATLLLQGSSVRTTSDVILPSGSLTLHATNGDVLVNSYLNVAGTIQSFYDVIKYSGGGEVSLISDTGDVTLGSNGRVNVSAPTEAGNAGGLNVSAKAGEFILDGAISARGGSGGADGQFSLDIYNLASLAALNATLDASAFTQARSFRVRSGDVLLDGPATVRQFALSVDDGSITVSGIVDASGVTGGTIGLRASGSVTLLAGSVLDASAADFSSAGKGGSVVLEAGSQINGAIDAGAFLDIQTGSTIDLRVASQNAGSAALGQFSGTLHLRAPQTAGNADLAINAIDGSIFGASAIIAEGYALYDLSGSGVISSTVQSDISTNGATFAGNTTAITTRLLLNNAGLANALVVAPGAEIINRTGDLTLGTTSSTAASDWNLATFRFGPKNVAGVLTMRAAGNLVFYNALSDGFTSSAYNAQLLNPNTLLPVNAQSWSYRLTAGADLTAADFHQVVSLASLGANSGSLKLGKNNGLNLSNSNGSSNQPGSGALTSLALQNRFQVIRTGSGDIDISTGRDVQLLNAFATIYTAGTKVSDATMGGTFDLPIIDTSNGGALGSVQQSPAYPAQYSFAGGNVTIRAQGDIAHLTVSGSGLVADSERQLPVNWLYRRGYVDPATGKFGTARFGDVASTTWWVDFSNFFEGVGALGGGDVTLVAGGNISNVDAVIPTNARMAGKDASGAIAPDNANLIELGGGDLIVKAAGDIDAGVYYVERGNGVLSAGGEIKTNSTRSPSLGAIRFPSEIFASETWLPTTLFLGKGSFDVSARGDVLLGPTVNPFLLPGGFNNSFWYKSYFSTYATGSAVRVTSLGGDVTLRTAATLPGSSAGAADPILQLWMQKQLLLTLNPQSASYYQPWLRLNETTVAPFRTAFSVMPGTLEVAAFSGDINLQGDLTLSPSPTGTLELLSSGAINGLQPNGQVTINGVATKTWGTSQIIVSDADPGAIPGVVSPYAYQTVAGTVIGNARVTANNFLAFFDSLFAESGSTQGVQAVLQTKQALHAPGVLHADDPNPLRLYAAGGNISGFTLFSPKAANIFASQDISDIALYLQNVDEANVSIVSSGRDLVAYNANSALRTAASLPGNIVNFDSGPLAGDIQISGPGTLQVLAGRNLDLGVGSNNADGTGVGINSIGNARNPYLPENGAELFVAAGIGPSTGLASSELAFEGFVNELIENPNLENYLAELDLDLGGKSFRDLDPERRSAVALKIFYLILRDAGRKYATTGNYDTGFAAIDSLFGTSAWQGDIQTRSRDIRTKSGGDIQILVPGGGLTLATTQTGTQLAPPGIITESGGNISIFTHTDVDIGISRIFTLRGGNEIIWSSTGDIAAGSSAKTVKSAPPTRVLIDPQSGDVKTDLAGLATGGGIGVLATVVGVAPGDVDLIAPVGTIDAGDAGIRVSGNLNIAAVSVLNAGNISVGGNSAGVPSSAPPSSAPAAAAPPGSSTAANASTAANDAAQQAGQQAQQQAVDSLITAEVLGYGGGEGEDEDEEKRRNQG